MHELVATLQTRMLGADVLLTGGKGFAPFGTDDPMVRPFVKYPANHHLAQILERDIHVLGATRWNITTVALSSASGGFRPFVEVERARATVTLGSLVFDPAEFYDSDRMWSLSAGVRVEAGRVHRRMGRYGAAAPGRFGARSHH